LPGGLRFVWEEISAMALVEKPLDQVIGVVNLAKALGLLQANLVGGIVEKIRVVELGLGAVGDFDTAGLQVEQEVAVQIDIITEQGATGIEQ